MKKITFYTASLCILFFLANCSKSAPVKPNPEPENTTYYRVIRVSNLTSEGILNSSTNNEGIFFSLRENKQINPKEAKTTSWDIAFSSLYNSFISGNNGSNSDNFGSGNSAVGGVLLLDKTFDEVVNVPTGEFQTIKNVYGTDESGDFGEGLGWYLYDSSGSIKGNGAADKKHLAYPLKNRTVIIKTANGDIAKLRILSVYKDQLHESQWNADSQKTYLTFDYVLVPKGTPTFEIKNYL